MATNEQIFEAVIRVEEQVKSLADSVQSVKATLYNPEHGHSMRIQHLEEHCATQNRKGFADQLKHTLIITFFVTVLNAAIFWGWAMIMSHPQGQNPIQTSAQGDKP